MKDQAAEALAPGAIRLVTASMSPEEAARLRAGGLDAQGTGPELAVSDGSADPCRCRLTDIAGGRAMLIFAHRPWARTDPYAETGPIFLCAEPRAPRRPDALLGALPEARGERAQAPANACLENDIRYGRGRVCAPSEVEGDRRGLPAAPRNACLHIRSATNACRQFRVERG